MKFLFTLLLLTPVACFCQYRITVIVDKVPASTKVDRLYIAGNFNQWEPADENTLLSKGSDGKFTKVFEDVQAGDYEFKFTQGTMETIECAKDGKESKNRLLSLRSDTTIHVTVEGWKSAKSEPGENFTTWSDLQQPYYSLTARVRKPVGAISRFRQTLPRS